MRMYRLTVSGGTSTDKVLVTDDVARALSSADALITAVAADYPAQTAFTFCHAEAATRLHDNGVLMVERPDGSIVSLEVEDIE